jgi:hypothetical protein
MVSKEKAAKDFNYHNRRTRFDTQKKNGEGSPFFRL